MDLYSKLSYGLPVISQISCCLVAAHCHMPCPTSRTEVDKKPLSRINCPENSLLVCTELWNLALKPPKEFLYKQKHSNAAGP